MKFFSPCFITCQDFINFFVCFSALLPFKHFNVDAGSTTTRDAEAWEFNLSMAKSEFKIRSCNIHIFSWPHYTGKKAEKLDYFVK